MKLSDVVKWVDPHLAVGVNGCCFRGQAGTWPILPKAYRPEFSGPSGKLIDQADRSLDQWVAESQPYLRDMGLEPKENHQVIAVAQHFGLATRALDWTSNPLVALFFVVIDHDDADGELIAWRFDPSIYNIAHPPEKQLQLFRPRPIHPRLKFQDCLLSLHPTMDVVIPVDQLFRLTIPAADKSSLRDQLLRYGIHHESIFASLDHLAQKLNCISTDWVKKNAAAAHTS